MLKMNRKFYGAMKAGRFFSTRQWNFETQTVSELIKAVNCAKDGVQFALDMGKSSGFEWNSYMKDFCLGVRKYILKDDLSSLEKAKNKLQKYGFQLISLTLLLFMSFLDCIGCNEFIKFL